MTKSSRGKSSLICSRSFRHISNRCKRWKDDGEVKVTLVDMDRNAWAIEIDKDKIKVPKEAADLDDFDEHMRKAFTPRQDRDNNQCRTRQES